ncbi:Uma2 family endonuclease [Actinokineospora iranica]|nr:Uma2 family endonuclease [Actinokineospora iranica]
MPMRQTESSAPAHLLTIEEYAALEETETGYTELLEGRLLMSPSPTPEHQKAMMVLGYQLFDQLPDHLDLIADVDVDLGLGPAEGPGFSRRPDLVVVEKAEVARRKAEGGILRAAGVLVVVEIVAPGSKRTDRVTKRGEYADAGIPHYWLLDIEDPVSLLPCHLAEEFGYQNRDEVTGTFTTDVPFPVTIDLDALQ